MGFIKDFKAFAMKGNVIDMAVGVIIGGAFGKIVTSLVNDIIMPLIGTAMGGIDFKTAKYLLKDKVVEIKDGVEVITPEIYLNYGNFIQNIVDFLISALSIFVTIRIITKPGEKRKKEEEAAAAAPAPAAPSNEEKLLTEIRDLLKEKK